MQFLKDTASEAQQFNLINQGALDDSSADLILVQSWRNGSKTSD